jgi:tRNA pseudouridine65 synthase
VEILLRDDHLIAVAKPSGVPVHRGWSRSPVTLAQQVRAEVGLARVHAAHRLDQPTSGVVLFALDPETARALGQAFASGAVRKRYLALVRGRPSDQGEIDHPISRRQGGPRRSARTEYRRLFTVELEPRHVSLVEARPLTGRLHQVRRHLKHIDHPVIGDVNYGKGALNRAFRERYGLARLALHASVIELSHPRSFQPLRLVAPLPADMSGPFGVMGIPQEVWDAPLAER